MHRRQRWEHYHGSGQDNWFEYMSVLYKDDSRGQLPHIKPDTAGIPITSEEIQHAMKQMHLVLTVC